jgi:hypothetical protein
MAGDDHGEAFEAAENAGKIYGRVVSDLLALETTRKASIEQRGIAVITTASGLVSLLIALSALLLGPNSSAATLGSASRVLLIAAIVFFVVAAGLGVAANAPRTYGGLTFEDLDRLVRKHSWTGDRDEAALEIAREQVAELKIAVELNNRKARYIQWAITAEVMGVGLVAAAVVVALA